MELAFLVALNASSSALAFDGKCQCTDYVRLLLDEVPKAEAKNAAYTIVRDAMEYVRRAQEAVTGGPLFGGDEKAEHRARLLREHRRLMEGFVADGYSRATH
jgi:hypothetical protein